MKNFFNEFKKFIARGNVMNMAAAKIRFILELKNVFFSAILKILLCSPR